VKSTSEILGPGRDLFVGPGAVRDSAFKKGTVLKRVVENCFQEVEIRSLVFLRL
jgi:hypothetical protein